MDLYGRRQEKAALARILDEARHGSGTALVLWGDPGIGKSALLEYAAEVCAPEFTVLTCRGARLESGLAFAALHELLLPLADRIDKLPAPQAGALRGALGYSTEPADRFLIGVAVLTLVAERSEVQPMLIIADDAQWMDESTTQCLAFVARRLRDEPVVMLLTGHNDPASGPWEKLPALEVRGLGDPDAQLLAAAAAPDTDRAVIERAVRTAGGNPLALQELPAVLESGEATRSALASEEIAAGPRLRHAFSTRLEGLSAPARAALLIVAAEELGDRNLVRQASAVLRIGATGWDEALRSGLLTMKAGDHIRFRHPLIRAVVYEEAPLADREASHRALASVLTGERQSELRAWHLAAAVEAAGGPDEEVAQLLEKAAIRAWECGGSAAAARALRRAADLSPSTADVARRLGLAARAAWLAGEVGVAREMLRRTEMVADEPTVAELSDGLRGVIDFAHGDQEVAYRHLLRDMGLVTDPRQVFHLGSLAVRAAWSAGRSGLQVAALRQLEGALPDVGFPNADLLPLLHEWWSEGAEEANVAHRMPDDEAISRLSDGNWRLLPPTPLASAWGIEQPLEEVWRRRTERLRRVDEPMPLALALAQAVTLDIARGAWTRGRAHAEEGLQIAEEIGAGHVASQCRNCLGWLDAAQGDAAAVSAAAGRTLELSVPTAARALSAAAYWNLGMSALFAGRGEEALDRLVRLSEPGHHAAHPTFAILAAPDAIEAAVQTGQRKTAHRQLHLLQRWAERTAAPWTVSAAHLGHALLASDGTAEDCFQQALDVPGAGIRPFPYARTRMLYGEWLRRARRRTDARIQLSAAAETFQRLNAGPLLARTRTEQELTGQRVRADPPVHSTQMILTPQELRVARLAAEGLTNREIGARLLISPRTVGHHLSNVFPKLGISSRSDLARHDFEDGLRIEG
ncbi:helix-turn-helix transcriptional regulator [Streptomyces wedmorensis]|uniref:helix-turn-helix transcriptional regulator n=1 Tax=Streptomyces wedmorensis TaxID=43759 RepID=UPI00379B5576